ncbi:hypothetical protein CYMTET_54834, partial [Cymbomonas tetramitiformis]
ETKQSLVDMAAMFTLLEERAKVIDSPQAIELHSGALERGGLAVSLHNVDFGYHPERPILNDVSFDVPAGTSLALVGTSGSGKSTVLRLLCRFYNLDNGMVHVGGRDVRDVSISSLRREMGVVPQDIALFNDTVFYNILYGRLDASPEECPPLLSLVPPLLPPGRVPPLCPPRKSAPLFVPEGEVYAAAKEAAIHDVIMGLPDGYNTQVGERGLKLSGGEKQRVALARVFLKGPRILLCDEATSALDTRTERAIMDSLNALAHGRTMIMVAHRLSTAAQCNKIVVLEQGRVVESGSHDALLAAGGQYASMWAQQQQNGDNHAQQFS